MRPLNIPPPPRGLPRRLRGWYVVIAAAISAVAAAVAPMCPDRDAAGRPAWRVVTVHDGDTVTCADPAGREEKIRLVGIDAPEYHQPYGRAAREALAAKLAAGGVRVESTARDQHGRLLATLFVGDRDINRELVADGLAWTFGGFAPDEELLALEAEARRQRRGLWADPRPVAPADWRATHPAHR
jgi:endonuclease YncB( thermonuclease family)